MINPTQKSPERAFALQKYLLLHSQHDALQKHLSQISSSLSATSSPSPSASPARLQHHSSISSESSDESCISSSASPTRNPRERTRSGSLSSPPLQRPTLHKRRSSLPTIVNESLLEEIEEDEMKLKDVNEQIKITLTTLLNCESVRQDRRYRNWVQTRLMDTEMELKKNRARSRDMRASEDAETMI